MLSSFIGFHCLYVDDGLYTFLRSLLSSYPTQLASPLFPSGCQRHNELLKMHASIFLCRNCCQHSSLTRIFFSICLKYSQVLIIDSSPNAFIISPLGTHKPSLLTSFPRLYIIVTYFTSPNAIFLSFEKIRTDWTWLSSSVSLFVKNFKRFSFPLPLLRSNSNFVFCSISLLGIITSTKLRKNALSHLRDSFLIFTSPNTRFPAVYSVSSISYCSI